MVEMRKDLPKPPPRMAKLPIDRRGYPIPRFVAWMRDGKEVNEGYGEPDFRVVRSGWLLRCMNFDLCWLCGEKLGKMKAFVVGSMCIVNRASGEPPCHLDCASWATRACPFMTNPDRPRNEKNLPKFGSFNDAAIPRNPRVMAIYVTDSYKWLAVPRVIRMGPATLVHWVTRGRPASRVEVEESIRSGLPFLSRIAAEEGRDALAELDKYVADAQHLLPKE